MDSLENQWEKSCWKNESMWIVIEHSHGLLIYHGVDTHEKWWFSSSQTLSLPEDA